MKLFKIKHTINSLQIWPSFTASFTSLKYYCAGLHYQVCAMLSCSSTRSWIILQSVDNLCTHSMSAKLYENLRQLCESYILSCLDQFVVDTIDTEQFLKLMSTTWQNHCNQMVSCLPRFRMSWELGYIWLLSTHKIWYAWPLTTSGGWCPQTEDGSKIDIKIFGFSLAEKGYCVVVDCGLIFWATLHPKSFYRH